MSSLRTEEMNQYYIRCKEEGRHQLRTTESGQVVYDIEKFPVYIKEFKYWHLVEAAFPYDKVAEKHHLLIAKRHYATSQEMTIHERAEFETIKEQYAEEYHCVLENTDMGKSVLGHHHAHLLKWKGETVRPGGHVQ